MGLAAMTSERCGACGFDGAVYEDDALLEELRALGPRWAGLLAGAGPWLRIRPAPGVWSAIEHAAHSREVTAQSVFGVRQALLGTEPVHAGVTIDLRESAGSYRDADLEEITAELAAQAMLLAQLAQGAGPARWSRGVTIAGDRTDVRGLLEHALHESLHHLGDAEQGLASLPRR
jgi:hypothetical protein